MLINNLIGKDSKKHVLPNSYQEEELVEFNNHFVNLVSSKGCRFWTMLTPPPPRFTSDFLRLTFSEEITNVTLNVQP